jgi:cysteate synthase
LFDALSDTDGEVFAISNDHARKANKLFEELEGIDLHPAAAVATASLIDAVSDGKIEKDAVIMLNITGGGEERFKSEKKLYYLKPTLVFDVNPKDEEVSKRLATLF